MEKPEPPAKTNCVKLDPLPLGRSGYQALDLAAFTKLVDQLNQLLPVFGRKLARPQ